MHSSLTYVALGYVKYPSVSKHHYRVIICVHNQYREIVNLVQQLNA